MPNSSLSTSGDAVLTALAQLGACQTNNARSFISIFDEKYQYIIAEATPTLPLVPGLSCTERVEDLWLCGTAIPRNHGVCEHALLKPDGVQSASDSTRLELPLTRVDDLSTDPRFRLKPFCRPDSPARSYAAVPIKTKRGISIGVYCVIHTSPIEHWEDRYTEILKNISRTIMRHLEDNKAKVAYRRSVRMARGIGSLLEERASLSGWRHGLHAEAFKDISTHEGALNAKQQAHQDQAEVLQKPFTTNDHWTPGHGAAVKDYAGEKPAPTTSSRLSGQKTDLPSETNNPSFLRHEAARFIFSRTANLIREAIEVEGCLFLDADTQAFGTLRSPSASVDDPTFQDVNANTPSSGMSSSDEDQAALTKTQLCRVLGFANSETSSIDGDRSSMLQSTVPEKLLTCLLKRYPQGKLFMFSSTGELQSSESSGEDSVTVTNPSKPIANATERQKLNPRPKELERLRQMFPNARNVAFVPVWDPKRNKWRAGGFVYTNTPTRQFSVENELSYLRAFGTLAMSEVLRHNMLEDERSKSDALSSLSHELRSPLHGIMLGVELLNDTVLSVSQGDIAHTMETCGRTLLDTVDHLLDFSRINQFTSSSKEQRRSRVFHKGASRNISDGMISLATNVQVDRLAEDVIESVFAGFNFQRLSVAQISNRRESTYADVRSNRLLDKLRAEEDLFQRYTPAGATSNAYGGVKVSLMVDPASDWVFHTQPGAIRRIIMNLFGNALKFTRQGHIKVALKQKPTEVSYRGRDHFISISVSDTGLGIGREFLQNNMFKPFMQENYLEPGTGLGLSLVKQITSQLRGRISVESQTGVGTTITVSLPLARPSPARLNNLPLPLPYDKLFTQQVSKLQGLRVRLLFRSLGHLHADALVGNHHDNSIKSICRDWLRMDVVTSSQAKSLAADLVLLHEEEFTSKNHHAIPSNTPCVVICRNAVTAYQHSQSPERGKWPVEFIAQPVAPRKLARILLLAFDRWADKQQDTGPGGPGWAEEGISPDSLGRPSPPSSASDAPYAPDIRDDQQTPLPGRKQNRHCVFTSNQQLESSSRPVIKRNASSFNTKVTFLLVDDNHINLMMLIAFCKKMKKPYITANNGAEAVAQYTKSSQNCKCILMDISMPVMDGLEATRRIRAHEREHELEPAVIVALTGLASPEVQREAFGSGMDLFLTKPVQMKELRSVISSYEV
ncbi:hypothetical protein NW761_014691 [Fusarium oxysporum]|nr:hypothetical protein NW758_014877 [Fusarium oxysporum]KAJ4072676.1 hypothetical protein NW761_014691 [Fusarium oxysporum]KAJ4258288.1 hypothetical protein NW764_016294 [Fusarium oxysporum]